MKKLLALSILFCAIAMPALAELTDADFDKIRLLVNEELKPVKADIETLKTEVAYVRGKLDILDKYVIALIALIVIAVGAPQIVMAWRSRRDRTLEKQIENSHRKSKRSSNSGLSVLDPPTFPVTLQNGRNRQSAATSSLAR